MSIAGRRLPGFVEAGAAWAVTSMNSCEPLFDTFPAGAQWTTGAKSVEDAAAMKSAPCFTTTAMKSLGLVVTSRPECHFASAFLGRRRAILAQESHAAGQTVDLGQHELLHG